MTYDERLNRILQRLPLPNCPKCGAPMIAENVVADGNPRPMDDAPFPMVWLVCKHNKCGQRLLTRGRNQCATSPDEVLAAFEDELNIR